MKANLRRAIDKANVQQSTVPIAPPKLLAGVVPEGVVAPVLAKDNVCYGASMVGTNFGGSKGFQYLAHLATRPEYRNIAGSIAGEITRKWIELVGESDDDKTVDKIKAITAELERLNIREQIKLAAEQECFFGRAQIYLDFGDQTDCDLPLVVSNATIRQGTFRGIKLVEAVWTTPSTYNSTDPLGDNFYIPTKWYVLGKEVHSSRLMTVITRPVPDILKPAYNFAGISLSQLVEPYVDNWLRTRQAVSDLLNNFSITALKTAMSNVLQDGDCDDGAGDDLLARAQLFTAYRSNQGLMLLDKETEDLVQMNTPLSGLHELQAQSQEHMSSITRIPLIIMTGISPSGLNASGDAEIAVFNDWINGLQEGHWRDVLEKVIKVLQVSMYGEVDPTIKLKWVPLKQPNVVEDSTIKLQDAQASSIYIADGVLDPSEVRERLANDIDSGYHSLDLDQIIVDPNEDVTTDKSVSEAQHRAMEAAAHGESTLGIPKKVGEEYVAKDS